MERVKCPKCQNVRMARAGVRWSGRHRVQGYKCGQCGYQYTPTNFTQPGYVPLPAHEVGQTAGENEKP